MRVFRTERLVLVSLFLLLCYGYKANGCHFNGENRFVIRVGKHLSYAVNGIHTVNNVHDYEQDPEAFRSYYSKIDEGIVNDQIARKYGNRQIHKTYLPIFVSEYGGIKWVMAEDRNAWGYGKSVTTEDEFFQRLEGLTDALLENPRIFGYCYTQLTDVEQEQNGLLTYDRRFKFAPEKYAKIFAKRAVIEE